jgi:arginine decarboxylase
VVWGIGDVCREFDPPHPTIISESGRALTAHHAVLVTNIIGAEGVEVNDISAPDEDAPTILQNMWKGWLDLRGKIPPCWRSSTLRGGSR